VRDSETISDSEQPDDQRRKIREILERFNDRFVLDEFGLIDRYDRSELDLIARPFNTFEQPAQYCFVVSRLPRFERGFETASACAIGHRKPRCEQENAQQPVMLSLNVELMQEPKRLSVPSWIWFERFELCTFGLRESIYKFPPFLFSCSKLRLTSSSRKIDIVHPRYLSRISTRNRDRQDVEAAPDRGEIGPELDVERQGERLFFERYHKIVSGWIWRVFDSHIEVGVQPLSESGVERWELGYGPINACLSF
jgi:hypothetical protein